MALKSAVLLAFISPYLAPALEIREAGPHGGAASLLDWGSKGLDAGVQEFLTESNRHLFAKLNKQVLDGGNSQELAMKQTIMKKVAYAIIDDKRQLFQHMSDEERISLAKRVVTQDDMTFVDLVAPPSVDKPVLIAPLESTPELNFNSKAKIQGRNFNFVGTDDSGAGNGGFQPSAKFESSGQDRADVSELTEAASASELPWGVGSPRTGDSLPNFHYARMMNIDYPKEWEYSLDSGDNIQSFGSAEQDVKLITQVLKNVTNGFYLDTNAGDGEHPSNTLLLELAGWRGLLMEPRGYHYLNLWSKMRKAWLFLGCLSPHGNSTKIGFDVDGNIDMFSGHMIHAHSVAKFMEEMGSRKTIDFWNLKSGNYEYEILQETLTGSGKNIEFGVILVNFDGRMNGRGFETYVRPRTKDVTEELIFDIMREAGFRFVGGLDPTFLGSRFVFRDQVFVNPKYFEARGLTTPTILKTNPPAHGGIPTRMKLVESWDYGMSRKDEIAEVVDYFAKSKEAAGQTEPIPKAHRVNATSLL